VRAVSFAGDAMRQLTTIADLVVALVTPAAARSRLVVLDRPTLACSDQQALETALTLARLHDGPAFRDHARSYGCMWIDPDDGPLAVVGGSAWGNVQVMVPGAGLFGFDDRPRGRRRAPQTAACALAGRGVAVRIRAD